MEANYGKIIDELLEILRRNGVTIRTENMDTAGGLCKLKNKTIFFIDPGNSDAQTAELCAEAVKTTIDVESIYFTPVVREFIEQSG